MNEHYYLKIGGKILIDDELAVAAASGAEDDAKKKAKAKLEGVIKEARVRIGTLLKTDNIGFLLAAGCSMDAGGVTLSRIPIAIEKELHQEDSSGGGKPEPTWLTLFYSSVGLLIKSPVTATSRKAVLAAADPEGLAINLEDYLTMLHTWRSGIPEGASEFSVGNGAMAVKGTTEDLDALIKRLVTLLTKLVDLPKGDKKEALQTHGRFIRKILTRPLNLRRAAIFTLNYDTLVEQAADAEGAVLVDGFVGILRRVFRPECYNLDFYFPAQTTEGRVHRFDRALHLYKLHGSITWHRTTADWQNPYGLYATMHNENAPADDVLIYPSPLKYGQSLGLPYSELFRRFGAAIAQPQSVLVVIGYSFGDQHVNALIRQALAIPSFILIVISPQPLNREFVKELHDLNDERVWIIGGRNLGTFANFTQKLLPDLREEEIAVKVVKTFNALAPKKDAEEDEEVSFTR